MSIHLTERKLTSEFIYDDRLAGLLPLSRLFFLGLMMLANYQGVVLYRPRRIKQMALPYDECDVEAEISLLIEQGMVKRYEVDGVEYLLIPDLDRYQKLYVSEYNDEALPLPEEEVIGQDVEEGVLLKKAKRHPGKSMINDRSKKFRRILRREGNKPNEDIGAVIDEIWRAAHGKKDSLDTETRQFAIQQLHQHMQGSLRAFVGFCWVAYSMYVHASENPPSLMELLTDQIITNTMQTHAYKILAQKESDLGRVDVVYGKV